MRLRSSLILRGVELGDPAVTPPRFERGPPPRSASVDGCCDANPNIIAAIKAGASSSVIRRHINGGK